MNRHMKRKKNKKEYIYGHHAVAEALENTPSAIKCVYISHSSEHAGAMKKLAQKADVPVKQLGSDKKTRRTEEDASHQGIIAEFTPSSLMIPYKEFIHDFEVTDSTAVVILGELQDPHNVGAVIRNAAAFGMSAVLVPDHNQAPITGTVVKVSAGMTSRIPIVNVGNLNTTIRDLKEKGFWVYGLDADGDTTTSTERYDRPSAFIVGNESKGLREKTRELCDAILSIPIDARCESLNAAVSAGVVLYSWYTQTHVAKD